MALKLYINGQLVDLSPKDVIAQTKQLNDINSVSDRQTNYTNIFKLPMTARNRKIMQFLSIPGNASTIPYQKNECSLFSDSGECFVYKGWAVITESTDAYSCHIYDGIIDIYKAIENTNLSDLGLSELNHVKNVTAVKDSWVTPDTPYLYILADYNGDMGNTNAGEINIDYLVPSVRISYLWDKVFAFAGATYNGSIFNMQQFQNLYMTFPKGLRTSDSEIVIFESTDLGATGSIYTGFFVKYLSDTINELLPDEGGQVHLEVAESGTYRFNIEGEIKFLGNAKMFLGKNGEGLGPDQISPYIMLFDPMPADNVITSERILTLEAGDSICVVLAGAFLDSFSVSSMTLTKLEYNVIDFEEALIDFPTKEFLNEVLQRFGLTMFKDKYSNNYTFLTQAEHLQTNNVVDWSRKFTRKLSETYVNGNYAQQNWFRYAYNDKEASHNDGFIDVSNVNLQDKRDVVKSKIYSPETYKTTYLNRQTNVYKLWDKEVEEDPDTEEKIITYKALDKRYYFLRAEAQSGSINVFSKQLDSTPENVSSFYIESYWKLSFRDIVQDFYYPLRSILDRATIVKNELYLREVDVINFDFKKLYYIDQQSSYFLVNKIDKYIPGKPTQCELVRVLYGAPQIPPPAIYIYQVVVNGNNVTVFFTTTLTVEFMIVQFSVDGLIWIQNASGNGESPRYSEGIIDGITKVRIRSGDYESNEVDIIVPSTAVYTP